MNEGTPSGVGYNKLNSFSVEDPAKRPLTFLHHVVHIRVVVTGPYTVITEYKKRIIYTFLLMLKLR
jgi:hypothetical protein